MLKKLTILLLIITSIGCQENTPQPPNLDKEIATLNSPEKLAAYYTEIRTTDQQVRGEYTTAVLQKHGANSVQYREHIRLQKEQDSLNLIKIEKLFVKYGYPKTNEVGELAASAPWTVVHHASKLQDRLDNYKMMRAGYRVGEIDDTAFAMYLNRTYEHLNNGQRLRMQGTFKTKTQIDSLLTLLNLDL